MLVFLFLLMMSAAERLAPCPDTPNCVSTSSSNPEQQLPAIPYEGTAAEAMARIEAAVLSLPRSRIIERDDGYLHAEFRTLVFRFVDDVEFALDDEAKLIHFRSAARVGRGDMGVNRRRMTRLSGLLQN